jgi:iron complex transport system ATP-binding protein
MDYIMQYEKAPRIEFDKVHFAYGDVPVLRDLSFVFEPGSFVGVIGPNGAGKTTLLRLLTGLQQPSQGTVRIDGTAVADMTARARARMLAVVPQNETIAFPYNVGSMVLLGRFPHTGFLGFERPEDLRAAQEAMRLVGIDHLAHRAVTDLSGGEQHRVSSPAQSRSRLPCCCSMSPAHISTFTTRYHCSNFSPACMAGKDAAY